jgi:hypothetical protein
MTAKCGIVQTIPDSLKKKKREAVEYPLMDGVAFVEKAK